LEITNKKNITKTKQDLCLTNSPNSKELDNSYKVNKLSGNTKSYLKEYSKTESEVVQPLEEKSKDLALLVIHWKNCLENSKRIFKDLKG